MSYYCLQRMGRREKGAGSLQDGGPDNILPADPDREGREEKGGSALAETEAETDYWRLLTPSVETPPVYSLLLSGFSTTNINRNSLPTEPCLWHQ